MQRNLMGWTNNSSVSWLTSQHFYSSCWKCLPMNSFWWRPIEELKALVLTLESSSGLLGSGCWWHQTLAQTGRSILAKTLYIFSVGAQLVLTSLFKAIVLKVSVLFWSSPLPPLPLKIDFMKCDMWLFHGMITHTNYSYHIGSHF